MGARSAAAAQLIRMVLLTAAAADSDPVLAAVAVALTDPFIRHIMGGSHHLVAAAAGRAQGQGQGQAAVRSPHPT